MDERWVRAVQELGKDENVYMKLSGAFNEFGDGKVPESTEEVVKVVGYGLFASLVLYIFTDFIS